MSYVRLAEQEGVRALVRCSDLRPRRTSFIRGACQPPNGKPNRVLVGGPPGACPTRSRVCE